MKSEVQINCDLWREIQIFYITNVGSSNMFPIPHTVYPIGDQSTFNAYLATTGDFRLAMFNLTMTFWPRLNFIAQVNLHTRFPIGDGHIWNA